MIKTAERWSMFLSYSRVMAGTLNEIEAAKSVMDPEKRLNYLLRHAMKSLYQEDYHHAAVMAWHILSEIDKESDQARDILKQSYRKIFNNS